MKVIFLADDSNESSGAAVDGDKCPSGIFKPQMFLFA